MTLKGQVAVTWLTSLLESLGNLKGTVEVVSEILEGLKARGLLSNHKFIALTREFCAFKLSKVSSKAMFLLVDSFHIL